MRRFLLICVFATLVGSSTAAQKSLIIERPPLGRLKVEKIIDRVAQGYAALQTFSADFEYIVRSPTRAQVVRGHARLMKPNYARLTFDRIAEPAYPSLMGSDGKFAYTFVPQGYDKNVKPVPYPGYDPLATARQASGLEPGGEIRQSQVSHDGRELRLWDSILLQIFFDVPDALEYFYSGRKSLITVEGSRMIDGVQYTVLYNHLSNGSVSGGATSEFKQRLFIGSDNLIHLYTLQFKESGAAGLQMMRLSNIRVNEPMDPSEFTFTPPTRK